MKISELVGLLSALHQELGDQEIQISDHDGQFACQIAGGIDFIGPDGARVFILCCDSAMSAWAKRKQSSGPTLKIVDEELN